MVVKQVGTKAVDLTRSVLVEMKQVSEKQVLINHDRSFLIHQCQFIFFLSRSQMLDVRHDNLAHFIGATIDPPNICIVSAFYSRGSLQVSLTL